MLSACLASGLVRASFLPSRQRCVGEVSPGRDEALARQIKWAFHEHSEQTNENWLWQGEGFILLAPVYL